MLRLSPRASSNLFCSMCRLNNNSVLNGVRKANVFMFQETLFPAVVFQNFHCGSPNNGFLKFNFFRPKDDITLWGRTMQRLGFTDVPKSVLRATGTLLYMKVADEIDYMKFFKACNLPDVYASWFTVLELHVWILSARLMQDGKEGRIARNALIKAMWDDNDLKSKKLEGALSSARKKELKGLSEQFHAAMISYDEGLLGGDHILAGALWRRFMRTDDDKPIALQSQNFDSVKHRELLQQVKTLEMLIIYVRSQFYMLNNLSREQLLRKRAFKFVPFNESLYELANKMETSSTSQRAAVQAR